MSTLIAWLKSKNWTTHSIAAAAVFIAGLISTDAQVRNLVLSFFEKHPAIGTDVVALAAIILKYSRSSSKAGTVAIAQVIAASPDPPTQAAVDAAKPTATGV
jgi:hypothetical protein